MPKTEDAEPDPPEVTNTLCTFTTHDHPPYISLSRATWSHRSPSITREIQEGHSNASMSFQLSDETARRLLRKLLSTREPIDRLHDVVQSLLVQYLGLKIQIHQMLLKYREPQASPAQAFDDEAAAATSDMSISLIGLQPASYHYSDSAGSSPRSSSRSSSGSSTRFSTRFSINSSIERELLYGARIAALERRMDRIKRKFNTLRGKCWNVT